MTGVVRAWHPAGMSNSTTTRPVIRASTTDIAKLAELLSTLFDAPVVITSSDIAVPVPAERHLVMIVAESPSTGGAAW